MRLLLIHRYFWPDTPPYASMLRSIGEHLAGRGHRVRVLAAQPSYTSSGGRPRRPRRERLGALAVERLPALRETGGGPRALVNLLAFPVLVAARVLTGPRPDLVMCSTAPQVTMGYAVSLAARARRARFVYHCMDLHPEIGALSGEFANPLVYRTLARMDRATMRRAAAIVVLSQDMRRSVIERDPALADRVAVLPNFALPEGADPGTSPLPDPAPGVLRVVFTGNLGRFQGLPDAVAALAGLDARQQVELVFMGAGRALEELQQAAAQLPAGGSTVRFVPHGPVAAARALMRSAHVGLVSLVPQVVRYAYPSKTATYAAEGLALLVVAELDSALAAAVRDQQLGWAVAPGDVAGLTAALSAAHTALAGTAPAAWPAAAAYAMECDEDRVLAQWSDLIENPGPERIQP